MTTADSMLKTGELIIWTESDILPMGSCTIDAHFNDCTRHLRIECGTVGLVLKGRKEGPTRRWCDVFVMGSVCHIFVYDDDNAFVYQHIGTTS